MTLTKMSPEEIQAEIGEQEEVAESFDVDEVLADMFLETMDIMMMSQEDAANFVLDLSLKNIKAEAASVILSDVNSLLGDMYFVAARGEVASQLMDVTIPRGMGIVGFSVDAGCAMAVSDVNQNPNFYKDVSEKTGFKTNSILSVPINYQDRTFGAVELVNKIGSNRWTVGEMNVMTFLAQKLGEHLNSFHEAVSLE